MPGLARVPSSVVQVDITHRLDLAARLVYSLVFLLPLVCWPGPGSAFSTPKIVLLSGFDLALAALWFAGMVRRSTPVSAEWLALAWVAVVSISALAAAGVSFDALLLGLLPVPLFWAISRGLAATDSLARAIWLGTLCETGIVVLQYCAFDPLRWLGWQPEVFASPRMRAYGTLGNPDFVAAWCCATLPFCWREIARGGQSRTSRALRIAAAALQIGAILATGSRVFALVVPLQAAMLAWRSKPMKRTWVWALPAAAGLVYLAPTRPLVATLEGRLYLAQVTVGHWRTPLIGYGPGSFEARFAVWQQEWLQARQNGPRAARFAGAVDRAHNDYLEFLVEYGPVGLGAFLCLGGWVAARAWRGRAQPVGTVEAAAAIGAATLLVIAAVDFPFHRPAEWSLLWIFSGVLARRNTKTEGV